jgi:hypothetical protein
VQRHHTLYFIANPFREVMLLELLIGGLLWCELLALWLRLAARRQHQIISGGDSQAASGTMTSHVKKRGFA